MCKPWIAVAMCLALALSAGTAAAQNQGHKIVICHNGHDIEVDVHALPAHLAHGDLPIPCGSAPPCACSLEFDPVLCTAPDGTAKTYINECVAACDGATGCGSVGVCSDIFNPVTCTNAAGETRVFANACQARLAGFGNCNTLCACGLIYAPVRCGDGSVFINQCVASCQGASGCTPL